MKISKKTNRKKGFFIAVEGDWPDCYKLNRYIKNYPDSGESAIDVLHSTGGRHVGQLGNSCWQNGFGDNDRHVKKDKLILRSRCLQPWESFDEVLKYLENKDLTKKGRLRCF
jgi:hypothetical protein